MDSSKTLVQGRARGFPGDPASTPEDDSTDLSHTLDRGSAASARIRISGERSPRPGEHLLGRYLLLERLGAGGFGTVWRAHDEQLDRVVAIKRIPLPREEDRERATREALVTARLSHPAIVALYEASADEDAFYLISELVEGDTLAILIAEDRISDEDVLEIGLALAAALEHAHARGVIHRDVKPQNVLVPDGAVEPMPSRARPPSVAKLADFGGARLAEDDALTRTGDVFGTLAYMAPEQSEGEEAGPSADLYSLALVLYEAFSGVNPVRARTAAATARRIGAPIEPLARRRRDLPRELTRALDTALVCNPNRRGTLADLRDAFVAVRERGMRPRLFARKPSARWTPDAAPERSSAAPPPFPLERAHPNAGGAGFPVAACPHPLPALQRRSSGVGSARAAELEHALQRRSSVVGSARAAELEQPTSEAPRARRIALPRVVWLGCLLAAAAWQAARGQAGVSLLLLAAAVPLLALPRRSGPGWLAAGLAPALGLAGLAGAFPALAGQCADWRRRAGLAALGFWWLALAEALLARRLWLGPPSGLSPPGVWEGSLGKAATQVIGPTLTLELLLGGAVWALAAVILPWIVRGRSAALDVAAAVLWTLALLAAVPLLERALLAHAGQPSPRGALLGPLLGCALAVCARALRGPV